MQISLSDYFGSWPVATYNNWASMKKGKKREVLHLFFSALESMIWVICRDALGGFPWRNQVKFWFDHCIRTQVFTWSWIAKKKKIHSRISLWKISSSCVVLRSLVCSCPKEEIEKLRYNFIHLHCPSFNIIHLI